MLLLESGILPSSISCFLSSFYGTALSAATVLSLSPVATPERFRGSFAPAGEIFILKIGHKARYLYSLSNAGGLA